MASTLLLLTCCILPWLFRWDGHKHLASVEILLPSHFTPEDGLRDIQVQGHAELCVGRGWGGAKEDVVAQHLVVLELDALVRVMIKDMQEHKVVAGWERLTSQLWIQAQHSLRPNPHIHARGHPVLSA